MARTLMQKEGRYAGGYAFPFCHIVVLSNINRSQIEREAPGLARLLPPATTITQLGCAGAAGSTDTAQSLLRSLVARS